MIKIIAAVRRRPGMTHAEYLRYIEEIHGGIARANVLGLSRYVQNHVFDGAFGRAAYEHWFHRDSVTELYFATPEKLVETFTHPYTRDVVGPDAVNFADLTTNLALPPAAEQILQAPPPAGSAIKVLHFVKATGDSATAGTRWQQAHEQARQSVPDIEGVARGHVRSLVLPDKGAPKPGGSDYFGRGGMPAFDGVASIWFSDEAGLEVFRRYEAALRATGFVDPDPSFFVYAREVEILAL